MGRATYGELNVLTYNNENVLRIGNYCSIGPNVWFVVSADHRLDCISTYPFRNKFFAGAPLEAISKGDIIVDDDVWIGCNATILSGVHIGQGAVIAAGAVVNKDVEPYEIVGGVPAKNISYRFRESVRMKLAEYDFSKLDIKSICDNIDALYTTYNGEENTFFPKKNW